MKKGRTFLYVMLVAVPLMAQTHPGPKALSQKRAAYQRSIDKELDDFSLKINELKIRAEKVSAEARIELQQRIHLLEEKKSSTQSKLDRLKHSSGDQWGPFKKSVDKAIVDLRKTYTKTLNKLR